MAGPVILYTPARATAKGNAFAGSAVPFNDPVDTAYSSSDPDRVDALFFLNQVQCEIMQLQQIQYAGGGAIQVRNSSGSTLNNGPVRITGYYQDASTTTDTGNPIFVIVAADAATNTYANALLLTSLANNTTGVAYIGGDFTPSPALDLSAAVIGDPVFLAAGGGMTRTAPSGADQMVQVIGQVKTVNATGVVAGLVQTPKKFGTSWLQPASVTSDKIGTIYNYQAKSANYAVLAADGNIWLDITTGSSADVTITLPAAAAALAGKSVFMRKFDSGTKTVVIAPNAADGINGNTVNVSTKISAQNGCIGLVCTGVTGVNAWEVISCNGDWIGTGNITGIAPAGAGAYKQVTTLTLPPGEWDISAGCDWAAGAGTITSGNFCVGTTTASSAGTTPGESLATFASAAAGVDSSATISGYRVVLAASTQYFLNALFNGTVSTATWTGRISARRIR